LAERAARLSRERAQERAATKTSEAVAAATDTDINKGDLGSLAKTPKAPMPKQSDFDGDLKAYGEAMRKWRIEQDADSDNIAQKQALRNMAEK